VALEERGEKGEEEGPQVVTIDFLLTMEKKKKARQHILLGREERGSRFAWEKRKRLMARGKKEIRENRGGKRKAAPASADRRKKGKGSLQPAKEKVLGEGGRS